MDDNLKEQIRELVKTNSVVNRAMMLYFSDYVSYEEALERMVIALVEIQEETSNRLLEYVDRFG
jgi:hypothetical protein